ncbi:MAG: hypothetical protein WBA02_05085 [Jannaschia helgolandensis]|uniref:hypothetical protein n=1 Tax=Jannaschia helgolandensis TaxID=188906 RepID=UPI003C77DCE3
MTNEELADLITARTGNLRDHFDTKLTAMQAHIYGKLLSIESDMLDLRGDIARLREALDNRAGRASAGE